MSLEVPELDLSWILGLAEAVGEGDPDPDDYGVPVGAVARTRANVMGMPVYVGPYVQAASLAHTLGRTRWLSQSNIKVACMAAVMYLHAAGVDVDPQNDHVRRLAFELRNEECTARSITAVLKSWPVQED